jgi:hypothetical protein
MSKALVKSMEKPLKIDSIVLCPIWTFIELYDGQLVIIVSSNDVKLN